MKNRLSKLILLTVVFFPTVFIGMLSAFGTAIPIEGRTVENVSILSTVEEDTQVLFFGYVGCSFICPNSLYELGEVLDKIHQDYDKTSIGGLFIDVNASTQIQRAHEYSQYFSSSISGYNVDEQTLHTLKKQFGLTVIETNKPGEEIMHTDHFFLVQRENEQWRVMKVISNNISKEEIRASIVDHLEQNKPSQIAAR